MKRGSLWFIAAFILLLLGGLLGLWNGPPEWSGAKNGLQQVAAATEFGYGVMGILAAGDLWRGRPRALALTWIWAVLLTAAGGLAPVAWGDTPVSTGLWSALASGLIALLVVWLARRALRTGAAAT